MGESAFDDATGAILTFGVLAAAMGTGEFSLHASLLNLLAEAAIGVAAGVVLGYLGALLIAHERWGFFFEYAPVVTIMAVIGAYFAADRLRASGFMAVFVFGIMLGNKDSFGFRMGEAEARRLDQYVETTAFIMRLFIFILLGSQVDFGLIESLPCGRYRRGAHFHVRGTASHGLRLRAARPPRAMESQRDAVHVLDTRDRRHSRGARWDLARHESARCDNDRVRHVHRDPNDDPHSGADDSVVGKQIGASGRAQKKLIAAIGGTQAPHEKLGLPRFRSGNWSGRRESNPRHTAWEAVVLPLNYARASPSIAKARCQRQGAKARPQAISRGRIACAIRPWRAPGFCAGWPAGSCRRD